MARINEKHGGRRENAGRKSKAAETGLAELLDSAFTLQDRKDVVSNLTKIAKGENAKAAVSAASLLLGYAYGKPTEKHEHSNPDGTSLLQPVADAILKAYGAESG